MRPIAIALAVLFFGACSGGQRPKASSPVCFLPVLKREATPEDWFRLLLHGYDARRSEVVGPALDCTGTPLTWQGLDEGCSHRAESLQPAEKLTSSSLTVGSLEKGRRLVWVQVQRFANGEALGPVAWVEQTDEGLEVHAVGSLRSNPERVRLRLEQISLVQLLVAEGELCHGGPSTCRRAIRVMPLRGSRFINEPLTTETGQCVGPAWFPIQREEVAQLTSGWRRSFQLATTLEFQPEQLVVHEQMRVQDSDPRQSSAPARLFRKAQAERVIRVGQSQLLVDVPSLWSRIPDFKG